MTLSIIPPIPICEYVRRLMDCSRGFKLLLGFTPGFISESSTNSFASYRNQLEFKSNHPISNRRLRFHLFRFPLHRVFYTRKFPLPFVRIKFLTQNLTVYRLPAKQFTSFLEVLFRLPFFPLIPRAPPWPSNAEFQ